MIEGFLLQVGAGYLVSQNFLETYLEEGTEYIYSIDFWNKHGISQPQAVYDRKYFYGILVASNRNRENQAILKNQKSQDGVLTWIHFKKLYAYDGSKELKLEKLEEKVANPYSSKSPGGMEEYIDTFQATMEQIDVLDPTTFSDVRKKRTLLKNVRHVTTIAHLVQKCRDDVTMSFDETAAYLRQNSILIDSLENSNSQRPSTMLRTESLKEDDNFIRIN